MSRHLTLDKLKNMDGLNLIKKYLYIKKIKKQNLNLFGSFGFDGMECYQFF